MDKDQKQMLDGLFVLFEEAMFHWGLASIGNEHGEGQYRQQLMQQAKALYETLRGSEQGGL